MIYSELMPDELAIGFLGRLRLLNDWSGCRMANATSRLRDALNAEGLLWGQKQPLTLRKSWDQKRSIDSLVHPCSI